MDEGTTVYSSTARVGAKCGRWNPTAEQVKVLTELFISGLRTPTTDQIQMISSHLSALGNIESKNVFYWFQNHKARERHSCKKRRRAAPPAADNRRVDRDATTNRSCCMAMEQQEVVWEGREREAVETLELFPLSSYGTHVEDHEKVRSQWKEMAFFDMNGRDLVLDLSLS